MQYGETSQTGRIFVLTEAPEFQGGSSLGWTSCLSCGTSLLHRGCIGAGTYRRARCGVARGGGASCCDGDIITLPPKVGETLWYGALWRGEWVALASFSAKCQARDAGLAGRCPQVRPAASGGQQHPVPAPAPGAQSRVPGAGAVRTPSGAGLAGTVIIRWCCWRPSWTRRGSWAGLPGRGLDRGRHDARLPPRPGRVPRRLHAEEGLRTCPDPARPSRALHSHPGAPLPSWETEDHAEC